MKKFWLVYGVLAIVSFIIIIGYESGIFDYWWSSYFLGLYYIVVWPFIIFPENFFVASGGIVAVPNLFTIIPVTALILLLICGYLKFFTKITEGLRPVFKYLIIITFLSIVALFGHFIYMSNCLHSSLYKNFDKFYEGGFIRVYDGNHRGYLGSVDEQLISVPIGSEKKVICQMNATRNIDAYPLAKKISPEIFIENNNVDKFFTFSFNKEKFVISKFDTSRENYDIFAADLMLKDIPRINPSVYFHLSKFKNIPIQEEIDNQEKIIMTKSLNTKKQFIGNIEFEIIEGVNDKYPNETVVLYRYIYGNDVLQIWLDRPGLLEREELEEIISTITLNY